MGTYDDPKNTSVIKFCLDIEIERLAYETILNNPNMRIARDELHWDKVGKAFIVVWVEEELE